MNKIASFLDARIHVLEHVVEGGDVSETLDILCRDTEDIDPAMRCSVLIYDQVANCLRHAAGPSLPDYYNDAIDGLQPGMGVGSCGTAAFTGERVIVEDVLSHPYWQAFRDLAKKVGFHACWSQPIYSKTKVVLGTFAMYYDEVRRPTEEELRLIQAQANLASLVIERKQTEEALKESEQRFRTFAESSSDWFWEMDADLRFTYHSERYFEITGFGPDEKIGTRRTHYVDPAQLSAERAKWDAHMADLRAHRPFKNFEYTFTVKDGSVRSARISGEPYFDAIQNFVGYRGTGTDITDHIKADLKLQESEQRFRDFATAASDWLWEIDENLRFTYFSEGIRDVIGEAFDIDDLLGKTRLEIASDIEENSEKWRKHMEDMEARKPIRDFTYTYVTPSGKIVYFSLDGNPIYDEQGDFRGYRGAGRDITEKILTENKIKASEERLSLIFESAAIPLAVIRLTDSVVLFANSAWLELFGRKAEDINSVRMEDMYVDIDERRAFFEILEADGRVQGMVAQFKRKNGETFYASFNSFKTVLDGEDTVISGMIDITERIAGEQALRESEQEFRLAIEKSPLPIALTKANGDIEHFNPKFVEAFGWTEDDIKTATDWWVAAYPDPEYRKRVTDAWEHAIADAQSKNEEIEVQQWRLTCKDDTEREVEFRMVPLTPNRHLIVINDITERMRAAEELKQHRTRLEELVAQRTEEVQEKAAQLEAALVREKEYNTLQKKFVALVSHEFRTPLTIIDGTAQRLIRSKDKLDADEIETRANKVRSAVERMVGLIDTTLYASQMDAGKIEMKCSLGDIGELLLDVCERQAEIAPDHQFNVEVEELPHKIWFDPNLLDHVFANLLSNAVKYAPLAPHIEVKGWQVGEDVVITVTDHGVGIPEDELPHMFERFFRASTAEGIKGTGLGLSVCKEFVEMHGGTIEVASVEGEGTTFTARLPINVKGQ